MSNHNDNKLTEKDFWKGPTDSFEQNVIKRIEQLETKKSKRKRLASFYMIAAIVISAVTLSYYEKQQNKITDEEALNFVYETLNQPLVNDTEEDFYF